MTNFRKTRSATNLIVDTNVQLRYNEITLLTSRNFTIDRTNALNKKHKACTREHVTFKMKAGKNFVIEFRTATYELAKQNLFSILQSEEFKQEYVVVNQSNIEVDTCLKIRNRKANGDACFHQKFVVNLYHTYNHIHVNGGRVDIFINDSFDNICTCIKKKHQTLDIINKTISTQLTAFQSSTSDFIQNAICKSNRTEDGSVQTAVGSLMTCCTDRQRINSISEDNKGDELPQDTLKPTEKCPICVTYVSDGIACDRCDFCFHYDWDYHERCETRFERHELY